MFGLLARIEIVTKNLKKTPKCYKRLETIRELAEKYSNDPRLLDIDRSVLEKHDFAAEALSLSSFKEKNKEIGRILTKKLPNVFRLETHSYAPEMNKLQYGSVFFKVPQKKTISEALKTLTLEQLKIIK